jgi:hypothetical protein
MSLRIRRGTDAQRSGITFDMGEIVWTTDGQQLWVGDGLTQGGSPVVGANVAGFGLAYDPTTRRLEVAGLSADNITNGVNNKFFATELAQDAAASLFVNGTHSNISFVYDDALGQINATVTLDGIGLTDVVADTTPQLGGNLDLNQRDITGLGNIDITGNINIIGDIENVGSVTTSGLTTTEEFFELTHGIEGRCTTLLRKMPLAVAHTVVESVTEGSYGSGINITTARVSLDEPEAVVAGDSLYSETVAGYDGTAYQYTSALVHLVDPFGTVATDAVPGSVGLVVWGNPDTSDLSKGMWLNSVGRVSIGRSPNVAVEATLDVNGFAKLAVLTAAPATPSNGMIAIADGTTWDPAGTGKSVMVVYLGGGWRVAATAP